MGTVTIGADTFDVYGTFTGAGSLTTYANGSMSPQAVAWRALPTDDDRERTMVEAARLLDRQLWQGSRTSSSQPLAWPRTGVVDGEGNAVADDEFPQGVVWGSYELAMLLAVNASLATTGSGAGGIRSITTGPVTVEWQPPTLATGWDRFPQVVTDLIGEFLAAGVPSVPEVYGDDEESEFEDDDQFDLVKPV